MEREIASVARSPLRDALLYELEFVHDPKCQRCRRWSGVQRCRVCRCSEECGCPGGCSWWEADLCSTCAESVVVVVACNDRSGLQLQGYCHSIADAVGIADARELADPQVLYLPRGGILGAVAAYEALARLPVSLHRGAGQARAA